MRTAPRIHVKTATRAPALAAPQGGRPPLFDVFGLHGLAGNRAVTALLSSNGAGLRTGPGTPLPGDVRDVMESRFGESFDGVRVHTGADAAASARVLRARAYTVGSHIVVSQGRFAPHTIEGRALLAHELAHVAQQRRAHEAPASSSRTEVEADRAAAAVTTGRPASVSTGAAAGSVQRAPEDKDIWKEIGDELGLSAGTARPAQTRGAAMRQAIRDAQGSLSRGLQPGTVDLGVQEHNYASDARGELGVTGAQAESAHHGPTSIFRRLPGYSRGRALTTLLPPQVHAAFDQHWKDWAIRMRRVGETHADAGQVYRAMQRAAMNTPATPQMRSTLAWRTFRELFGELGATPGTSIPLPYANVKPTSVAGALDVAPGALARIDPSAGALPAGVTPGANVRTGAETNIRIAPGTADAVADTESAAAKALKGFHGDTRGSISLKGIGTGASYLLQLYAAKQQYEDMRKKEHGVLESGITAGAGLAGGLKAPGGPWSLAINLANTGLQAAGAPQGVTDVSSTAAGATPSTFIPALIGQGARSFFNIGQAIGGNGKAIDRQVQEMMRGEAGTPLQGYALIANLYAEGATGLSEELPKAIQAPTAAGKAAGVARAITASADRAVMKTGSIGQNSPGARLGSTLGDVATVSTFGYSRLGNLVKDISSGVPADQAIDRAARREYGDSALTRKIQDAGDKLGDTAFQFVQKDAAPAVDKAKEYVAEKAKPVQETIGRLSKWLKQ